MRLLFSTLALTTLMLCSLSHASTAQSHPNSKDISAMHADLIKAFAPTGVLRASLNMGNPVLANRDAQGKPFGISIDLAYELGKKLGVPVELIVNETAGKSVATLEAGRADVGFFAIDPERGRDIAFTAAYVQIEGYYLVRDSSSIQRNEQIDVATNRVVVGKGSAYDLFLTRHLKNAPLERVASSQVVVSSFLDKGFEVAAGVKQQLEADTKSLTGVRLLAERFMVINQAMGVPKTKGPEAALFLRTFVEEMKAQGVVKNSMTRYGIEGAGVGPAADPKVDPLTAP
jgi:polar amino acid transport system substrate-binding protein